MLGLRGAELRGRPWRDVFASPELRKIADVITQVENGQESILERQIRAGAKGRELTLLVVATTLADDDGNRRGIILFFEDVSHLLRVERMEAWREVARRIAHEIKNPLTPIQLSAQRLRKRYLALLNEREGELLDECTRTIIGQVDELKRLVNEFSSFARLPAVELVSQDLNTVVEEALVLFREGHRDISFEFRADADLPHLELDREAIKRAVINMLDNAVAACQTTPNGPGRVELITARDSRVGVVRLEVADNGCGMTPDVKARALEPYFSTKKDGSGLGLAIVSAIAADHQAYVRLRDNEPRGTRLVIEFPIRRPALLRAVAQA
jgi:two-component system nitrogen regulation sensor histidine kinase NtrY